MKKVSQRSRKENSCFNYEKRLLLEGYLLGKQGYPKITQRTTLSRIFGCDRKTIYNEIKRGLVAHIKSDLSTVVEYNADYAQQDADLQNTARGRNLKIGTDFLLCERIRHLIVEKHYSPYAVLQYFEHTGWPTATRMCEKTLYNWVYAAHIPGVSGSALPNQGVKYRAKSSPRRFRRPKCAEHSIDTRPKEVMDRKTFGHWEIDTIHGGKHTSPYCLFTMTERNSRNEIATRLANTHSQSVVDFLDSLETKMGSQTFRKIFISVTCDGGPEFMDSEGIQRSCIDGKPRTKLYCAHPYAAYERGTNEVQNRMLRRFFPKGCDFSYVCDTDVEQALLWMNAYPRRVLKGETPQSIYTKNVGL